MSTPKATGSSPPTERERRGLRGAAARKSSGRRTGEAKPAAAQRVKWKLRLYVAGPTARTGAALANLRRICDERLAGEYAIEVVDVVKHPKLAHGDQVLALPNLVRKLPPPMKKLLGDFSNAERVIGGLCVRADGVSVRKRPVKPSPRRVAKLARRLVEGADGSRVPAPDTVHHAYRVLVEAMNEGAASIAEDGIILYCNGRFAELLGQPLTQVMGSHLQAHVAPAQLPALEAILAGARHGESRGELSLRGAGRELPALLSVSAIEDRGRRTLCLIASDLSANEHRFRRTIENMLEGCVILDRDLTYLFVNKAHAQQVGRTAAEMVGHTLLDVFPGWVGSAHLAVFRRAMREQTPQSIEAELVFDDGRRGWYGITAEPVPEGLFLRTQDITERKHAEQALRRHSAARERLASLYAVLSEVNEVIVRRANEHALHQDVCRILADVGGYPLVWIGQVCDDRVVVTAADGVALDYLDGFAVTLHGELGQGPTGRSIREGRPMVIRDFLVDVTMGPWRERAARHGFRSSAAFPLHRGNAVIGALTLYAREPAAFDSAHTDLLEALTADVSYAHDAIEDERLRAMAEESLARSEAELRAADARKSQFLALLSHELRNPLAPIKNGLAILDRAGPGSEQARRAKAVIERQVNQLTRLVDDLLDITRLTRGKFRLERNRLDLVDAVRRTAEDHRPIFEGAGLGCDVALPDHPIWLDGDAERIVQAVGNVLANAAKFTPAGGRVSLSVVESGQGGAEIRVRDSGPGIAGELLPRLFEPFTQAESTLDRSKGGLGLGLALVKGVVEMHGGSVEARSAGLGQGSEFVLRLPVDRANAAAAADVDAPPAPCPAKRVLIVEDNVDAAESLRDVLETDGHQVAVCNSGPQALARAPEFSPEVVICDIGLPEMDGYQVARAFRAHPVLRSAFLVALTGYAQPEDLQRSAAAGFDAHIAKPASIEAIEAALSAS